jgi:hypothetical protein
LMSVPGMTAPVRAVSPQGGGTRPQALRINRAVSGETKGPLQEKVQVMRASHQAPAGAGPSPQRQRPGGPAGISPVRATFTGTASPPNYVAHRQVVMRGSFQAPSGTGPSPQRQRPSGPAGISPLRATLSGAASMSDLHDMRMHSGPYAASGVKHHDDQVIPQVSMNFTSHRQASQVSSSPCIISRGSLPLMAEEKRLVTEVRQDAQLH